MPVASVTVRAAIIAHEGKKKGKVSFGLGPCKTDKKREARLVEIQSQQPVLPYLAHPHVHLPASYFQLRGRGRVSAFSNSVTESSRSSPPTLGELASRPPALTRRDTRRLHRGERSTQQPRDSTGSSCQPTRPADHGSHALTRLTAAGRACTRELGVGRQDNW